MNRLTAIDLQKMSDKAQMLYIQDLLTDAVACIKDLAGEHVRYEYVNHVLNHAKQAVLDLDQINERKI
jgi:hypothetical protein